MLRALDDHGRGSPQRRDTVAFSSRSREASPSRVLHARDRSFDGSAPGGGQGERPALVHSSGALWFGFVIGLLPAVFVDFCSWLGGVPASALEPLS